MSVILTYQNYAIAANWNATSNLINVEALVDANGTRFKAIRGVAQYSAGLRQVRGDGTIYMNGYETVSWVSAGMTFAGHVYLRDTILGGAYSGKVTIKTRLDSETYGIRNGILQIPDGDGLVARRSGGYLYYINYVWTFTRLQETS